MGGVKDQRTAGQSTKEVGTETQKGEEDMEERDTGSKDRDLNRGTERKRKGRKRKGTYRRGKVVEEGKKTLGGRLSENMSKGDRNADERAETGVGRTDWERGVEDRGTKKRDRGLEGTETQGEGDRGLEQGGQRPREGADWRGGSGGGGVEDRDTKRRDRDREGTETQRERQIPEEKVQRPGERDWGGGQRHSWGRGWGQRLGGGHIQRTMGQRPRGRVEA